MALAEGQARAAIHGGASPELDAEADAAIGHEMREAWRYLAKRGRRPKGIVDCVLGVGDYLRIKGEWLTDVGRFKRTHPDFSRLWFALRLCCELCDGYLVVRGRRDRKYKFAGCSQFVESGCTHTLGSREYAQRKADVILAIMCGIEPPQAFFMRNRMPS